MRQSNRRAQPKGADPAAVLWGVVAAVVVILTIVGMGGLHLGYWIEDRDRAEIPWNPIELAIGIGTGDLEWTAAATWAAVGIAAIALALVGLFVVGRIRAARRREPADDVARYMGHSKEIRPYAEKETRRKADRWGVEASSPGVPIATSVFCKQQLYASYEDMMLVLAGPRMMKTNATVIPAILEAPGAVLTTSNKRDVVDATRAVRSHRGTVWVFDPQQVAKEEPTWWWNPLSYVTDDVQAGKLAEHFASSSSGPNDKKDAYFDNAAKDLLGALLLAAAEGQRPITDVYLWVTDPSDEQPLEILHRADWTLVASQLEQVIHLPDKQRAGVYGSAQQMVACLKNSMVTKWVTRQGSTDMRPEFDAYQFIERGEDTLYSLSKEGQGSAGPLVTALTVAVCEAAEDTAASTDSPASTGEGRLKTPLVGVLDEAANVCRWSALPDLYSHFGSRGIVLMTLLQSWSQGVDVWGESGMKKLWSAANVKLYGGNVAETDFLKSLDDLIGSWDKQTRSVSTGRGARNVSQQITEKRILDVSDLLGKISKNRGVFFGAGCRPCLVKTIGWFDRPQLKKQMQEAQPVSVSSRDHQSSASVGTDPTENVNERVASHG